MEENTTLLTKVQDELIQESFRNLGYMKIDVISSRHDFSDADGVSRLAFGCKTLWKFGHDGIGDPFVFTDWGCHAHSLVSVAGSCSESAEFCIIVLFPEKSFLFTRRFFLLSALVLLPFEVFFLLSELDVFFWPVFRSILCNKSGLPLRKYG